MSRIGWNIGGQAVIISSHGYVNNEADDFICNISDLGFDEFGHSGPDALQRGGMWDMDMTWPNWWTDKRLRKALRKRLDGKATSVLYAVRTTEG
jgi:hypothetical protein